ncbi:MAG: hypothetical protein WCE79_09825 [Xanthobacteraceae bacterium]
MIMRSSALAFALVAVSIPVWTASAHAISMQECSAKYKAAQAAGTIKGMKWNDFRKAECSDDAAKPAASTTAAPKAEKEAAPSASAPAAATAGKAVFPSAVAPKYSKESEGKARMLTCLDQYNANKAGNGNGGMKWIAKGGGYYSECNKRLKG